MNGGTACANGHTGLGRPSKVELTPCAVLYGSALSDPSGAHDIDVVYVDMSEAEAEQLARAAVDPAARNLPMDAHLAHRYAFDTGPRRISIPVPMQVTGPATYRILTGRPAVTVGVRTSIAAAIRARSTGLLLSGELRRTVSLDGTKVSGYADSGPEALAGALRHDARRGGIALQHIASAAPRCAAWLTRVADGTVIRPSAAHPLITMAAGSTGIIVDFPSDALSPYFEIRGTSRYSPDTYERE